jgi:hypothetical protein
MKPHVSLTMYVHTSSGLRIFQGTLYLGPADSPLDRSDLMCSSCHDPWSMSSHVMGSAGAAAVSRVQYTVHSTQYTVHSTQYTVHSTQYTVHSTQYTVHSIYCADLTALFGASWGSDFPVCSRAHKFCLSPSCHRRPSTNVLLDCGLF